MPIESSHESDRLIRFRGDGAQGGGSSNVYLGPERRIPRVLHDHRVGAANRIGEQIADGLNNHELYSFRRQPGVPSENLQTTAYMLEDGVVARIFSDMVTSFDRFWRRAFSDDHDFRFRDTRYSPVEDNEAFRAPVFSNAIYQANKKLRGRAIFVLHEKKSS